jgi:predicted RNA-binding Zn ribbon-like protein
VVTNSKFKFIGGSLCLDFVNTVGGRISSGAKRDYADRIVGEKFETFGDLAAWGRMAGILTSTQASGLAHQAGAPLLDRVILFREALYRVAKSVVEAWTPPAEDLELLNREITTAGTHRRLAFSHGKLVRTWNDSSTPERILWTVAESAFELLPSPEAASLRQCPGEECGWLFLDTSRNHARRWCQMKICGNRAKVRRFRQNL